MKDLVRQNNMQYAGNFSNTLVTKSGCKGTSNNRAAAAGVYQAGGDGSAGDRGYSTSIVDGSGALDSPMRTYEGYGDSAGSMRTMAQERGGNNFPVFSKSIASLSGGRKPKTKKRGKKFYKGSRSKTMPGKEDFTTKKKSKMYNEKRFKRLFGRRTGPGTNLLLHWRERRKRVLAPEKGADEPHAPKGGRTLPRSAATNTSTARGGAAGTPGAAGRSATHT